MHENNKLPPVVAVKETEAALVQQADAIEKEVQRKADDGADRASKQAGKTLAAPMVFFDDPKDRAIIQARDKLALGYQKELDLPSPPILISPIPLPPPIPAVHHAPWRGSGYRISGKELPMSPIDMAEQLLQQVHMRRYRENLFLFDGAHYAFASDNIVRSLIQDLFRDDLRVPNSQSIINGVLAALKAESSILGVPDDVPNRLAVANGEIDLDTMRLLYPNPEHFLVHFLQVDWLGYKPCPMFEQFLRHVSGGDPALQNRVLEAVGYLLVPDNRAKRLVLFQGPGNTGKSVLGALIQSFFPPEAVSGIAGFQLGERFSLFTLANCRLNISMDLPDGVLDGKAVAVLKQITGGDLVPIEGKHRDGYSDYIRCKVLFGTNHPITLKGRDDAFAKRILLIPFRYPVPEEHMDHDLLAKLKRERPGILYQALLAFRDVVRRNYLFTGEERFGFKTQHIQVPDTPSLGVDSFIRSCCVMDEKAFTPTETLHSAFLAFCAQSNQAAIYDRAAFSRALNAQLQGAIRAVKKRVGGIPTNGYVGIKLREEGERNAD